MGIGRNNERSQSSDIETNVANNQATNSEIQTSTSNQQNLEGLEQRVEALENVNTDLGEVEGLTGKVSNTIGNVINALVPRDRDKAGISFSLKIPVHPLVKITIGLSGTAMRLGDRVMLMTTVSLGARFEKKVKAFWVEMEAYLQVAGEGYLKTIADTPQERFEFIALGIREIVSGYSEDVAEMMMSPEERKQVISNMSDSEFIELGLGINVGAGVGFDTDNGDEELIGSDGKNSSISDSMTGASVSGKYLSGIKFSDSDNDGELETTKTGKVEVKLSASFDFSKFKIPSLSGSPSVFLMLLYSNNKLTMAKVSLGLATKLTPNMDASLLASMFLDMVNTVSRTIIDGQKMLGGEGGMLVGKLGRAISGLAIGDEALSVAVPKLSDSLSANYSHSLSVGVKWSPDSGCSLELDLSKTTSVEKSIGDIASVGASLGETIFRHIEPLEL